jgi:AcrR family transcriptional regulator
MSATSPPDGTMRADARRNRQRLIEAALAAFAEHGADDASLDEIARRAGVGIGTLYRHFPTRQALLEAVYRSHVEALCVRAQDFSAAAEGASATDALARWLEALVAFAATKRNLTISMMSSLGGQNSEVVSSCSTMIREAVVPLLARAQQAGEIRPDVDVMDLLKMSHAISVASEYPSSHSDQAQRLLTVMLDGLRHGASQDRASRDGASPHDASPDGASPDGATLSAG